MQWAQVEAEHLSRPTFRQFTSAMRSVQDEKNNFLDFWLHQIYDVGIASLFPDTPYAHPILGHPWDLQTPDYDGMKYFFESQYV